MYFQLQVSTLPTGETEYGLLLTPNLVQIAETPKKYQERQKKRTEDGLNQAPHPNNKYNCLLSQVLYSNMLPTPTASIAERGTERKLQVIDGKVQNISPKGIKFGINIRQLAEQGFLPKMLNTPTASDKNGGVTRPTEKLQYGTSLVNQMHGLTNGTPGTTSQLSPQFVLEMMGFPTDWTLLPFLSGETNQSKQEETQSSPR
jgi:hypothetical protein